MSQYIFDNAAEQVGQRFHSLEALYDPRTVRLLEATGVGPGWRCLEVGAGGGSIATWLAERVGLSGHVLVTDIDPRHLEALAASGRSNVEVQRHDVGLDPLPAAAFDLVHARLVLLHVPQREAALANLVAAVKLSGWLVVEDYDSTFIDRSFPAADPAADAAFAVMWGALLHIMEQHGSDLTWGRSLHRRLVAHGLVEVGLDGQFAVWAGGSVGAAMYQANFAQVRAEVVAAGLVTETQVDRALTALDDPTFAFSSSVMMTAWGRKP